MLDTFSFCDWVYVSKREFSGPNWKIAYDGYLEYYHVPVLHRDTFGVDATNQGLYYAWGPHQHIKSPATEKGHLATETLGYMSNLIDKKGIMYIWNDQDLSSRELEIKIRDELGIDQKILSH